MVDHCSSLGKTGRLAKEKAKGSHMLVTIGTINATAIFLCTKNITVISGAPDTIIITISLIAIFSGTTL